MRLKKLFKYFMDWLNKSEKAEDPISEKPISKEEPSPKKNVGGRPEKEYPVVNVVADEVSQKFSVTPIAFIRAVAPLETTGFFTPVKGKKRPVDRKDIIFPMLTATGEQIDVPCEIIPAVGYGRPITEDFDKYRAFQHILTATTIQNGIAPDKISFSDADILRLLGGKWNGKKLQGGKLFHEVDQWVGRMGATRVEIKPEYSGKKPDELIRFSIFNDTISVGDTLPNGEKTARHYVTLSPTYLKYFQDGNALPIDHQLHNRLGSPIAKVLLPHLKIGFFASTDEARTFRKRYSEICKLFELKPQDQAWKIRKQFKIATERLLKERYISSFNVHPSQDRKDFILFWKAGEKFFEELKQRNHHLGVGENTQLPHSQNKAGEIIVEEVKSEPTPEPNNESFELLKNWKYERAEQTYTIDEPKVRHLAKITPPEVIKERLESFSYVLREKESYGDEVTNPAGLLISFIERHETFPIPETYKAHKSLQERERVEAKRQKHEQLRQEKIAREEEQKKKKVLDFYNTFDDHTKTQIDKHAMDEISDTITTQRISQLEREGKDPLESVLIRSAFEANRTKLLLRLMSDSEE